MTTNRCVLKLSEARILYSGCQKIGESAFVIRRHCWKDHPDRRFSQIEVLNLLLGRGVLKTNHFPSAKADSFIWLCKDNQDRRVEIVVVLNDGQIQAIAISAYREV